MGIHGVESKFCSNQNGKSTKKMKSRTKARCEWLVQHLKDQGYSLQVPIREIRYEIADHLGGDERTVNKYLHKIAEYGYMKMVNPSVMEFCGVAKPLIQRNSLMKFIEVSDDEPP